MQRQAHKHTHGTKNVHKGTFQEKCKDFLFLGVFADQSRYFFLNHKMLFCVMHLLIFTYAVLKRKKGTSQQPVRKKTQLFETD